MQLSSFHAGDGQRVSSSSVYCQNVARKQFLLFWQKMCVNSSAAAVSQSCLVRHLPKVSLTSWTKDGWAMLATRTQEVPHKQSCQLSGKGDGSGVYAP